MTSIATAERDAIRRMRRGHEAAARRSLEQLVAEGPQPERAVTEALAAVDALAEEGLWPGPRDVQSEREVERVRARWVKIERHAQAAAKR